MVLICDHPRPLSLDIGCAQCVHVTWIKDNEGGARLNQIGSYNNDELNNDKHNVATQTHKQQDQRGVGKSYSPLEVMVMVDTLLVFMQPAHELDKGGSKITPRGSCNDGEHNATTQMHE
jgi:hypothetical protein